jgi:hypothetical protein
MDMAMSDRKDITAEGESKVKTPVVDGSNRRCCPAAPVE